MKYTLVSMTAEEHATLNPQQRVVAWSRFKQLTGSNGPWAPILFAVHS